MLGHRRMGCFKIAREIIDDRPEDALAALDGCIVLRAEMLAYDNTIEYFAIHPDFDVVPLGEAVSVYVAVVTGGKRRWEKPNPVPAHLKPAGW